MHKFKTKFYHKIVSILLTLVISISPLLFSGCSFWPNQSGQSVFDNSSNNQQNHGSGSGGSGNGGSSGGSGNDQTQTEEDDYRESLDRSEYDNYFKNYRITYKTDSSARQQFNEDIINQNDEVSKSIYRNLYSNYYSTNTDEQLFLKNTFEMQELTSFVFDPGNKYLLYKDQNDDYKTLRTNLDTPLYLNTFSHICKDTEEDFVGEDSSDKIINKIKIALTLIQQGHNVEDEDGSTNAFDELYQQNLRNIVNNNGNIKDYDELENLANNVSHLGFTEKEKKQLELFVNYYIIGKENIDLDNQRFVNCYFTDASGNPEIKIKYYAGDTSLNDSPYNKFLTDETYATGYVDNQEFKIGLENVNDKNLEGVLYYATNYLASIKEDNNDNGVLSALNYPAYTGVVVDLDIDESTIDTNPNAEIISKAIYDKLINTNALLHNDNNIQFNGNVWRYDSKGNINSSEAKDFVVDEDDYVLFSVRLPGFKNYVNTVHQIVQNTVSAKVTDIEYLEDWQEEHQIEYPYLDENGDYAMYPNVPFTYFADYDNDDMLFDGETGVAKMFSGFECYQNMVLMPQADVDVESGALFITRQRVQDEAHYEDGTTDHSGDFDITVYVRYYDAEMNKYAVWEDAETHMLSEFYNLGTKTVEYIEYPEYDENGEQTTVKNYVPTVFDFSIKDILLAAEVGGIQNESCTLAAFDEDTKLFSHDTQLVTKDNYGWWFNEISTPDGKNVIVFDGKAIGAPSYFELVFSCSRKVPFQFCFYPTVAYAPISQA